MIPRFFWHAAFFMRSNCYNNSFCDVLAVGGMKHLREHGFLHRDIKPGNILITQEDDGRYVVEKRWQSYGPLKCLVFFCTTV